MNSAPFLSLLGPGPWPRRLATLAAFLVPALALTVASGYSYGAMLLLLGALATLPRWLRHQPDRGTLVLACVIACMGGFWLILAAPEPGWNQFDRPVKFFLGAACLLFVTRYPPRPAAFYAGLLVGCIGCAGVALWQVYVEHQARASGFPTGRTNAIQWGNLAMLLGAILAVQTIALRRQLGRWRVVLAGLASLGAVNASVLSQSRGGWLALLLCIPVILLLLFQLNRKEMWRCLGVTAAALLVMTVLNHQMLAQRWAVMEVEVQGYEAQRAADNSVGQRLEHWRFAWDMGRERPLLGWTTRGYMEEKERRVAAGLYKPAITEYVYVHNEVLDVFVKAGAAGLACLLALYLWPVYLFWPSRRRLARHAALPADWQAGLLAVRLGGLCVPLLYMGFGLTQVFFAHNSGIMGYLFLVMLQWAAVLGLERQAAAAQATPA
ncbi:O-antigen ligase family protein [Acidovorax sp. FG27]|uniref:O-antigen ligase family protein n=1 Tax=Acidovorax sp. FG27 TaxID=3133652 RepID=UPI0030EA5EA9